MVKKQKFNKRKWANRLLFLVLFVGAVVITYFVWDAYFSDKKDNEISEQQEQSGQPATLNGDEKEKKKEVNDGREHVDDNPQRTEQYDGEDPNIAEQLSGVITYTGVESDRLIIRLNIDQYLENGECELSLKQNGAIIHNEVTGIVSNVTTATCEGFDLPVSLVGNGHFDVVVNISAEDKNGIITGEIDI